MTKKIYTILPTLIKGVHQIALTKHNTQIRQLVLTGVDDVI